MHTEPKKITLTIQVDERTRDQFKAVAERNNRSMSAQIVTLIEREISKNTAKAA